MGDEATLFQRFVAQETGAIRQIEALVARVVAQKGFYVPASERKDLVQQIILEVLETVRDPRFAIRTSFEGFVCTVACRQTIDWVRRARVRAKVEPTETTPQISPHQELEMKEEIELGRRVLFELREPCRKLFELHAGEGLTYREMSARLGRTEGALKTQLYECLKEARLLLDRLLKGGAHEA